MSALERVWYGGSAVARVARVALLPLEIVYGAAVRVRAALYDHELLRVHPAALPLLAIGNVSVGGTGKTPVAAWAVAELQARGARPAVLLRGYGDDEPLVHAALNPGALVVTDPDRLRGVDAAAAAGADCVVLDDAFQHRRIARTADWVLVSAERFVQATRLLPAGPLREPVNAIARADVAIVTRKTASSAAAIDVADRIASKARVPVAVVHLAPNGVVDALDETIRGLDALRTSRVVSVGAVGEPDAFFAQLRALGATVVRETALRDHHRYTPIDVRRIIRTARDAEAVVCTLKDAVKLAPLWPRDEVPLWYVSQRAHVEHGQQVLDGSLAQLLAARAITPPTAGAAG